MSEKTSQKFKKGKLIVRLEKLIKCYECEIYFEDDKKYEKHKEEQMMVCKAKI